MYFKIQSPCSIIHVVQIRCTVRQVWQFIVLFLFVLIILIKIYFLSLSSYFDIASFQFVLTDFYTGVTSLELYKSIMYPTLLFNYVYSPGNQISQKTAAFEYLVGEQ